MQLKQKLAIALCSFYLFSVIGIALSMHFCGGKLASVSLYSSKPACKFCKNESAEKKDDGCCKNKKVEVKVKDQHQAGSDVKPLKIFSLETLLPTRFSTLLNWTFPRYFNKISNKAPPSISGVPIHLFNCVFRN